MQRWQQPKGFTLIELLLVLSIILVLLIVSIKSYQHYRQQTQLRFIKNDIGLISMATDSYFHAQGCGTNGKFRGHPNPTIGMDLDLAQLTKGRGPLVTHYAVSIVDTKLTSQQNLPIYQTRYSATLSNTISAQRLNWYRDALGAASVDTGSHTLIWVATPNHTINHPSSNWLMNSALMTFKNQMQDIKTNPDSNCAQ